MKKKNLSAASRRERPRKAIERVRARAAGNFDRAVLKRERDDGRK